MEKRVVLGLSGGMDSAYAAIKLKEEGYNIVGVYALMHDSCNGLDDAEALAKALNIEFLWVDARATFEEAVIKSFASDYVSGRTPNPCVKCNPSVKFKTLCDVADRLGIHNVATGHYATPCLREGRYSFSPAADATKDQGYFLYGLSQDTLKRIIMPLSSVVKKDIKAYFADNKIFEFTKGESNDICFAADDYREIICAYEKLPEKGQFVDINGKILGEHDGIHNYTVGQRKGLGIALGRPAFVREIDSANNRVVLSFAEDALCDGFKIKNCNLMATPEVLVGDSYKVKVRYRANPVGCKIVAVEGDTVSVAFDEPQRVTAKGQSAVFYNDEGIIAFGGVIC